jgi:beta-N-acetylhexosaminidase
MDPDVDRAAPSRQAALSRRRFLRGAAAAGVAASLGGVAAFLAACSPQTSPSPSSSSGSPAPSGGSGPSPSAAASASAAEPSPSASAAPTTSAPPGLSLEQKIAGLMIVGFRGSRLEQTPWIRTAVADRGLRGVILFDRDQLTGAQRNVLSGAQVRRLVADLRAAAAPRAIVASIDQEGGIVTRLGPAHGFPALASEAEIGGGTVATARRWASTMGSTLADAGIDLDYAPVVDLNVNPHSPAIGGLDRSFSADPDVVVRMATVEIEALRRAGVRSALKHFPGIGSSTTNTDFGVADVTKTWKRVELEPFRRLIAAGTADVVMAGHVVNGQLDPDRPASLSKAVVTDLLRGELGWDGVVVTDDLQAAAITKRFGADEAVLLALEAGNDLLLFANQQVYEKTVVERVVRVVAAAVASGRLPESRIDEAWTRVEQRFGAPTP